MNKKVLWKACDGREFLIDMGKLGLRNMEDLQKHIAELRKKHGYEEPTLMLAAGDIPKDTGPSIDDLPDHLRRQVENIAREVWNTPDPKTMN